MFDNLFGFAGPLGTAFALVGLMVVGIGIFRLSTRAAQLPGYRSARI